jgi:hypothetical protein
MNINKLLGEDVPAFFLVFNYEDEDGKETGFIRNSFVTLPTMEVEKYAFSKDENEVQNIKFSKDEDEQIFFLLSIIADKKIRMKTEDGKPYDLVFSKENISILKNKMMMNADRLHKVDKNHNRKDDNGIYMVEVAQLSKDRLVSPLFPQATDGSLITTYYVPDKKKYLELKNDPLFVGSSVEVQGRVQEVMQFSFDALYQDAIESKIENILIDNSLNAEEKETMIMKIFNHE